MPTQAIDIQVLYRDPANDPQGTVANIETAYGTTEDGGATAVIPLGYLPNLANALPQDVLRTVIPPPVPLGPPSSVSRTDDAVADPPISTLVFS